MNEEVKTIGKIVFVTCGIACIFLGCYYGLVNKEWSKGVFYLIAGHMAGDVSDE